jgi:hypothetical protein
MKFDSLSSDSRFTHSNPLIRRNEKLISQDDPVPSVPAE